ncbi:MAG: hypothetical protein SGILL_001137 [Bacillariaceae sp.]
MPKLPRIPKECLILNDSSVASDVSGVSSWQEGSSSNLSATTSIQGNRSARKRKVRFVVSEFSYIEPDETQYHLHPPLLPCELFYTDDEYKSLRMEMSVTLEMIEKKDFRLDGSDEFCTRGVEELTPIALRRRLVCHVRTFRTLLREQTRQQQLGIHDPDSIALNCLRVSAMSIVRAHDRGTQDAQMAYQIHHENDSIVDEDPIGNIEDSPSEAFFQEMKSKKVIDASESTKSRCHSLDTVSTVITDDLSERSVNQDDHDVSDGRQGSDHITLLASRPTPIEQIARIFHHNLCWAR